MAFNGTMFSSSQLYDPTASAQKQAQLCEILQNWNLTTSPTSRSAILPPSISPDCLDHSDSLLSAIYELSRLTVGRRERAHSLLNTYFQERIREGSYSGRNKRIFATLEVRDVERAITSAERLKVGLAVQKTSNGVMASKGYEMDTVNSEKKRKYEGLEEIIRFNESCRLEEMRPTKLQKPNERNEIEEISPKTLSPLAFPASPPASQSPTPPVLLPLRRSHITLPPIMTTHPPPEPFPTSTPEHFVQAAQRATHDFNVCRIELSQAEKEYVDARQRFEEAVERMEGANAAVWGR